MRFTGWGRCDNLDAAARASTVGLYIHKDAANAAYVGTDSLGLTSPSEPGIKFKPWGNDATCIRYNGGLSLSWTYGYDCVEQYAIHEFGHVLGFIHEWQHPLTSDACRNADDPIIDQSSYSLTFDSDRPFTVVDPANFDPDSIMTYGDECADVTGVRFGSPNLSPIDIAGLQAVYRDRSVPLIQAQRTPLANSHGWNRTDVTITFECADQGTAGIASCTPASTISAEGANLSVTGIARDKAGNVTSLVVDSINIDKTVPSISASTDRSANSFGWYNAPVTVSFAAEDALSGIDSVSAPVTLVGEGGGQSATGTAEDKASNDASATASSINIDMTRPSVTYTGNAGTYTVDQMITITCSAADTGSVQSGIASTTCQDISGPAYSSAFTIGSNTYAAEATDQADNTNSGSTSFTVEATTGSIANVTKSFVTNPGVATTLIAQSDSIAATTNPTAKANKLAAYEQGLLRAQTDKSITAEHATILLSLVKAL